MPFPVYDIASETANGRVNLSDLHDEIVAAGPYTPVFEGVTRSGGDVTVHFDATPPVPEQVTVTTTVGLHQGDQAVEIVSIPLVTQAFNITSPGFTFIAGVQLRPEILVNSLADSFFQIRAVTNVLGTGARLRLVEEDPELISDDVVLGARNLDDTVGALITRIVNADDNPPRGRRREYRLEGRLSTATSAVIRSVVLRLMENVP
ncbi:MAG: hypothetical protein R3322_00140 [Kiloniellales bacterium]|nr:hypothetical protein [Kiloniellales bacterium]